MLHFAGTMQYLCGFCGFGIGFESHSLRFAGKCCKSSISRFSFAFKASLRSNIPNHNPIY